MGGHSQESVQKAIQALQGSDFFLSGLAEKGRLSLGVNSCPVDACRPGKCMPLASGFECKLKKTIPKKKFGNATRCETTKIASKIMVSYKFYQNSSRNFSSPGILKIRIRCETPWAGERCERFSDMSIEQLKGKLRSFKSFEGNHHSDFTMFMEKFSADLETGVKEQIQNIARQRAVSIELSKACS